jgi:hypothetical protein
MRVRSGALDWGHHLLNIREQKNLEASHYRQYVFFISLRFTYYAISRSIPVGRHSPNTTTIICWFKNCGTVFDGAIWPRV